MSGFNLPDGCSDADIDALFYDPTPDRCSRCWTPIAGDLCDECEAVPEGACPEYWGVTGRIKDSIHEVERLFKRRAINEKSMRVRIRNLRVMLIGEYRVAIRLERARLEALDALA